MCLTPKIKCIFCWLCLFRSWSSIIALIGANPVPVAMNRGALFGLGVNVKAPAGSMCSISLPSVIELSQLLALPWSMTFTHSSKWSRPGLLAIEYARISGLLSSVSIFKVMNCPALKSSFSCAENSSWMVFSVSCMRFVRVAFLKSMGLFLYVYSIVFEF